MLVLLAVASNSQQNYIHLIPPSQNDKWAESGNLQKGGKKKPTLSQIQQALDSKVLYLFLLLNVLYSAKDAGAVHKQTTTVKFYCPKHEVRDSLFAVCTFHCHGCSRVAYTDLLSA